MITNNPIDLDAEMRKEPDARAPGSFDALVEATIAQAQSAFRVRTDLPVAEQVVDLGGDPRSEGGFLLRRSSPTPSVNNLRIQDKVVLLLLTFRAPGNERSVKDKAILQTDANLGRLRVGKRLVECDEYRAISIHDEAARVWVQRMALPSPFKSGTHVIPLAMLDIVDKGLATFSEQRREKVEAYIQVYDQAVTEAKASLGELFKPDEYLPVEELRAAYRMSWQYVTLQPPTAMEELNSEIFERERDRLQAQWDESIDTMRDALRVGMAELVDDMVGRLGSDKKLKPTKLLERFEEFLATFDARNITGDDDLALLASKARGLLAGVDTETLTKSKEIRESVRAGFAEAQATLAQLETAPKRQRQISFTDE